MGGRSRALGSSASISPPVQAQSAGDQKTAARLSRFVRAVEAEPVLAADEAGQVADQRRCGISAPLGGPVVPLV